MSIKDGRELTGQPRQIRPRARTRYGHRLVALVFVFVGGSGFVLGGFRLAAWLRETRGADELAPASGRFVQTAKGRVFVQEAGPADGPPVMLVHGMAAWSEFWRPTIDRLAALGYRVIAIDLPPFGFSERDPGGDYGRRRQAGRLDSLLAALGHARVTIVAHSIGAAPVVETAMRHPDRIGGLVLICGALGLESGAASQETRSASWLGTFLDTPLLRDPVIAATLTNPLATGALFRRLVAKPEAIDAKAVAVLQAPMRLAGSTSAFGGWLRTLFAGDPDALGTRRENYARLAVPVRLIWGDRDTITPLDRAREAQRLFAGSKLAVLPGIGHVPQIEDAGAFHHALEAALRDLSPVR